MAEVFHVFSLRMFFLQFFLYGEEIDNLLLYSKYKIELNCYKLNNYMYLRNNNKSFYID